MSSSDHPIRSNLHPLAKNLWRQLDGLSEADQRFVHNALWRRLAPKTQLENQEIAIAALQRFDTARREAAQSMASEEIPNWARGTPSKRNYNAWRDARPDRSALPSTTLIVNAFDQRWGDALAAAGLGVASNVLAGRGLSQGKAFGIDEVKACLRQWMAQVDPDRPLVQADYVAWATRHSGSEALDGKRFPTLPTVVEYLGSWSSVLIELGALDRHPDVCAARRRVEDDPRAHWALNAVEELDLEALPEPAGLNAFEDAAEWLRFATARLPKEKRASLKMEEWDVLRAALILELARLGNYAKVLSSKGIKERAEGRSWPAAKQRAGLLDGTCISVCSPTTKSFEDEELIDALAGATRALGHVPTRSEYSSYRQQQAEEKRLRLPSEATIRMRLGNARSWESVGERLVAERPELRARGKAE